MKWIILTVFSTTLFLTSTFTNACSNVFVAGNNTAAVARTMDLEMNTGNKFGFGAIGWKNTSNINAIQSQPIKPLHWINRYAFLGQTGFGTYVILDGINSAGLYAGFLDLPNITYYPTYNPKDKRPELGLTDLADYVLGTANSVPNALNRLNKAQIVENAFSIQYKGKTYFVGNAIHLVLRDKYGNAAVIEWVKGKQKLSETHIYFHKAGTTTVSETISGQPHYHKVYHNTLGGVVTNAPSYSWQLNNTRKYDYVYTGNTNKTWDGLHMNGSGMAGIPGDWTPPSRFARASQLLRLTPTPKTEKQALNLAYGILSAAMHVPVGSNSAATIWASVSDLKNGIYYFKNYMSSLPNAKTNTSYIRLYDFNNPFVSYNINRLKKRKTAPKGWIPAKAKVGPKATAKQIHMANEMAYSPTAGKMHYKFILR